MGLTQRFRPGMHLPSWRLWLVCVSQLMTFAKTRRIRCGQSICYGPAVMISHRWSLIDWHLIEATLHIHQHAWSDSHVYWKSWNSTLYKSKQIRLQELKWFMIFKQSWDKGQSSMPSLSYTNRDPLGSSMQCIQSKFSLYTMRYIQVSWGLAFSIPLSKTNSICNRN